MSREKQPKQSATSLAAASQSSLQNDAQLRDRASQIVAATIDSATRSQSQSQQQQQPSPRGSPSSIGHVSRRDSSGIF